MARNLELKVRCRPGDLADIQRRLSSVGVSAWVAMTQRDTYFSVSAGRLKLRRIEQRGSEATAELIHYHRPDERGARWSDYDRLTMPPDAADQLRAMLDSAVGVLVVVEKDRRVAIVERTRVHLDCVTSVGDYVELETVVSDLDRDDPAEELARVSRLAGIDEMPVEAGSYSDLVIARRDETSG